MSPRITLESPVADLPGVGEKTAQRLAYLDMETVRDLLLHAPFRYEDLRNVTCIRDVRTGAHVVVQAGLVSIGSRPARRRRMTVTEALVQDDTGALTVVWFNQPYLEKTLQPGDTLRIAGTVQYRFGRTQLVASSYEKVTRVSRRETLTPVYGTTAGLTQKQLRFFVASAFRALPAIPDPLPDEVRRRADVPVLRQALWHVHFPGNDEERARGLRRLQFDELLLFHLHRLLAECDRDVRRAFPIPFQKDLARRFVASLPFALTPWQKKAAWEILQDMERDAPMRRLLEGDVGSGKTVVAAIAAVHALASGMQVACMAPTEILARQHFATLRQLLQHEPYPVALWTSGFREFSRDGKVTAHSAAALRRKVAEANAALVVGTHALLERQVELPRIGLVIVDEQQRFGVMQRATLHRKGGAGEFLPHLLSLSATPIPRTLALALAGDLKISRIKQLPSGRQPVATEIVEPSDRPQLYARLDEELAAEHQAFVVAPLISASEQVGSASAEELYDELRALLPHRRLGLLHGKLSSAEKDAALDAFVRRETDLLVTTAVIEVGIDVPNATTMIIEGAERFGLSQLHQLRGRVGRGTHAGRCFLVADALTPLARRRLDAVASTNDGFRIAELDLGLRGPGDMAGTAQSGFLDFQFATLDDPALVKTTAAVAAMLLRNDPHLARVPALTAQLAKRAQQHGE